MRVLIDALNEEDVLRAMEGQDILFCSLEGDVLTMAKNIVVASRPPMLLRQARQLLHYCVVPEYRTVIMKSMN